MTNNTTSEQMELSLNPANGVRGRRHRANRLPSAQWWFAQMRAAVERAPDWQNHPPVRLAASTSGNSEQ